MTYIYVLKLTRLRLNKRKSSRPLKPRDLNVAHPPTPEKHPLKRAKLSGSPEHRKGTESLDIGDLRDVLYSPSNGFEFDALVPQANCVLDDDFALGQALCQHDLRRVMPAPQLRTIPLPDQNSRVVPFDHHYSVDSRVGFALKEDDSVLPFVPLFHPVPQRPCTLPTASPRPLKIHELLRGHRLAWDLRIRPTDSRVYSYRQDSSGHLSYATILPILDRPALRPESTKHVSISFSNQRMRPLMQTWGPVIVRSSGEEPISLEDMLEAIFRYFDKKLTGDEILRCTGSSSLRRKMQVAHASRLLHTGRSKPDPYYRRIDLLEGLTQFRHMEVDFNSEYECDLRLSLRDS